MRPDTGEYFGFTVHDDDIQGHFKIGDDSYNAYSLLGFSQAHEQEKVSRKPFLQTEKRIVLKYNQKERSTTLLEKKKCVKHFYNVNKQVC